MAKRGEVIRAILESLKIDHSPLKISLMHLCLYIGVFVLGVGLIFLKVFPTTTFALTMIFLIFTIGLMLLIINLLSHVDWQKLYRLSGGGWWLTVLTIVVFMVALAIWTIILS